MTHLHDSAHDPVVETDLQRYIDGHISLPRRIAVEAHLAARPELAARVMQDMRLRDELTLALAQVQPAPSPETGQAARRLSRALRWGRRSEALRRLAAVGMFLAIGWFAHAEYGALGIGKVSASGLPPAFVEEAIDRFDERPPVIRESSSGAYDPLHILAETAIALPALPDDWQVQDVAVAPSAYGPGVGLSIATPDMGSISLIALRPGVFDVVPVTIAHRGELAIAYWQIGDVAYALVTQEGAREIDEAASRLLRTLY